MAGGRPPTWVPTDVKLSWLSFLDAADLAQCSGVNRAWASLATRAADAAIVRHTCAPPPLLPRLPKLLLLHRLNNAAAKENMGYLLSWASGSREHTPFLHKLLLLRDALREDAGLPGGLHDAARPAAYDGADEEDRARWTYRGDGGAPGAGGTGADLVTLPPLVVAAGRGNADAVHLLLLFGEGAGPRRRGNERALYAAAEQGNALVVAALLGRVPLRPPRHPPHVARRLGLLRPTWPHLGPAREYVAGVSAGPLDVPRCIAEAKARARAAAARGIATSTGVVASAAAAAAAAVALDGTDGDSAGGGGGSGYGAGLDGVQAAMSHAEASVAQAQLLEADGRYRSWCRGYHMGSFWQLYDSSLAQWEARHGALGGSGGGDSSSGAADGDRPSACSGVGGELHAHAPPTLTTLAARLAARGVPGSGHVTATASGAAAEATQVRIVARLPSVHPVAVASRPCPPGVIHPTIPPPVDYGVVAAAAIAARVRLNVGPAEARTPLLVACERGRAVIAYLLLSHADPDGAAAARVPDARRRRASEDTGPGAAAAAPAGAALVPPAAAPAVGGAVATAAAPVAALNGAPAAGAAGGGGGGGAPPATAAATAAAGRDELASLAAAVGDALAIPAANLFLSAARAARRRTAFAELLAVEPDEVDVEARPAGQHTALCHAAERGDALLAGLLLHWGADPNARGRKDAPPLLLAAMAGHTHVVRLLLRATCDLDAARAVAAVTAAPPRALVGGGVDDGSSRVDAWGPTGGHAAPDSGSIAGGASASASSAGSPQMADGSAGGAPGHGAAYNTQPQAAVARTTARRPGGGDTRTAATAAVGGVVASQTRGAGRAAAGSGAPEDAVVDTADAGVVGALLAAAASEGEGASGGGSDAAHAAADAARTVAALGISATMFLPPAELAVATAQTHAVPSWMRFAGATSAAAASAAAAGLLVLGIGRGFAALASTQPRSAAGKPLLAPLAPFRGPLSGNGLGAGGAAPLPGADAARLLAVAAEGSTASYGALQRAGDAFRARMLRAAVSLCARSRAVSGVGALPGRAALDVNAGDESGYTALFISACAGAADSVAALLAAGADAACVTKRGKSPLYGAVEKCHLAVVELLLPRYSAAQVRANTTYGTNVMHAAGKAGNNRIKERLNEYLNDVDARDAKRIRHELAASRWPSTGGASDGAPSKEDVARRQEAYLERLTTGGGVRAGTGAGGPVDMPDVSNTIERLRRLAEQQQRAEEYGSAARRARRRERRWRSRSRDAAVTSRSGGGHGAAASPANGGTDDDSTDSDGVGAVRRRGVFPTAALAAGGDAEHHPRGRPAAAATVAAIGSPVSGGVVGTGMAAAQRASPYAVSPSPSPSSRDATAGAKRSRSVGALPAMRRRTDGAGVSPAATGGTPTAADSPRRSVGAVGTVAATATTSTAASPRVAAQGRNASAPAPVAAPPVAARAAPADVSDGAASVFDRLAARAREADARRERAIADAAAAARALATLAVSRTARAPVGERPRAASVPPVPLASAASPRVAAPLVSAGSSDVTDVARRSDVASTRGLPQFADAAAAAAAETLPASRPQGGGRAHEAASVTGARGADAPDSARVLQPGAAHSVASSASQRAAALFATALGSPSGGGSQTGARATTLAAVWAGGSPSAIGSAAAAGGEGTARTPSQGGAPTLPALRPLVDASSTTPRATAAFPTPAAVTERRQPTPSESTPHSSHVLSSGATARTSDGASPDTSVGSGGRAPPRAHELGAETTTMRHARMRPLASSSPDSVSTGERGGAPLPQLRFKPVAAPPSAAPAATAAFGTTAVPTAVRASAVPALTPTLGLVGLSIATSSAALTARGRALAVHSAPHRQLPQPPVTAAASLPSSGQPAASVRSAHERRGTPAVRLPALPAPTPRGPPLAGATTTTGQPSLPASSSPPGEAGGGDAAARDERNRLRELARAQRLQQRAQDELRRAEAEAAALLSTRSVTGAAGSLARAAAAYGAPPGIRAKAAASGRAASGGGAPSALAP